MPKRKNKPSGFGLFMMELQEKHASKGNKIPLSQMKDIADPQWKAMSAEQKEKYSSRAKLSRRVDENDKLDSHGVPLSQRMAMHEEEENKEIEMIRNVREYVHGLEQDVEVFKNWVLKQSYYIMSFNVLCYTDEGEYYPVEVGIAEYSIVKGVVRSYHKFIHPGQLPMGYSGKAKRHSDATHQIPFIGHPDGERDYILILKEIQSFLCPFHTEDDFPPIFSVKDGVQCTYGCLQWLKKRAGWEFPPDSTEDFKVWDLRYLLMDLRSGVIQALPSIMIAEDLLTKTTFDYTCGIRCEFHEELDCKDCSLGCVMRLCFLMSDCLCGVYGVEVTDKHLPSRSRPEKNYEVHNPVSAITQNFSNVNLKEPPKPAPKGTSGLYDLEEDSDDDSAGFTPVVRKIKLRSPTTAFEQLKLSSNPSTSTGQGLGRGKVGLRK